MEHLPFLAAKNIDHLVMSMHRIISWNLLSFFVYGIMSSAYNENFTSSLPFWIPFIAFFCLIPAARTSDTLLNGSGESGHACLVPKFY